jgi:putative membrane protein
MLRKRIALLIVNLVVLAVFTPLFIARQNYEFLGYVVVIILVGALLAWTDKKINYENGALWGLSFWAFLHLAGGGIYIGGKKLYELILIPLSTEYEIFKYDQFVHIIGFGVATYVMYLLLRPLLQKGHGRMISFSIIILMAGLGVGAINEMLEFLATVIFPETGVGGYNNTSLDLFADLIGGFTALFFVLKREKKLRQ